MDNVGWQFVSLLGIEISLRAAPEVVHTKSSRWHICRHRLHRALLKLQLSVNPVTLPINIAHTTCVIPLFYKGLEHITQSTALNPLELMVPKYGIFYQTMVNQLCLCKI